MNKLVVRFILAMLVSIFLVPSMALAHIGAGGVADFGHGFGHPIGGADHLLAMVAVGLWASQMGGRATWIVPGVFIVMMLIGAVFAVSGAYIPYIETGILVSILVFGILIAGAFRLSLIVSAALVGIFAVFHGYAHGNEMAPEIGAILYGVGFVVSTTLLHILGTAIGFGLQKSETSRFIRLAGTAVIFSGAYLAVS